MGEKEMREKYEKRKKNQFIYSYMYKVFFFLNFMLRVECMYKIKYFMN